MALLLWSGAVDPSRKFLVMVVKSIPKKVAILGVFGMLMMLAVLSFQWNVLRRPVASYISHSLGRTFTINGDLHVELSPLLLIQADDVVLANPHWASEKTMAQAGRVMLRIDIGELFSRRVVLPEIRLVDPQLLLERNVEGKANWEFPALRPSVGKPPAIGSLSIQGGVLHYRDPSVDTDVILEIASTGAGGDNAEQIIHFAGRGTLRKQPFVVEGHGAPLLSLRNPATPYRLEVQVHAGDTWAKFAGSFVPLLFRDIDGDLELKGADLSKLYPIIPVPLPWTPPYELSGHLVHDDSTWAFHRFSGKVGHSDLSGEFLLDKRQERPMLVADIASQRLNYKDLGGLVGLPRGNAPRNRTDAAPRAASGKVLPDEPYNLERLRVVDAKVDFSGASVNAADLPFDDVRVHLELKQGELTLRPLNFGIAGGNVITDITLDAHDDPIRTTAEVSVRNLDLARVVPQLKPPTGSAGTFGGSAHLSAIGNSVARMLGSLNGELALIMSGGQASALTLFLTNLDLANAAALLLRGDDKSDIRCVVTSFTAKQGVMVANTFVADTTAVRIDGNGSVDLGEERYDMVLTAKSKKPSVFALRGPIVISGSFRHPDVKPAVAPVAVRAGAAVALGMLATPLAALLPLIDVGGGKDSNCHQLIGDAERSVAESPKRSRSR